MSLKTFFALSLCSLMLFTSFEYNVYAKTVKKASVSKKSNKKTTKKKKRKRRVRAPKARKIITDSKFKINTVNDLMLSQGVVYKNIQIGNGKLFHSVHLIEYDLKNKENYLEVLKGKNYVSGLEKLQDISRSFDSTSAKNLLAAVNANFWKAYSNLPIGPTVINGNIVQMNTHRRWSSAFFDVNNNLFIDNFHITANLYLKNKQKNLLLTSIDYINYRGDTSDIVLYNIYGGDTIPYISPAKLDYLVQEAMEEMDFSDSTEDEFDTLKFKRNIIQSQRNSKVEYTFPKIRLTFLSNPAINKDIQCLVTSNKTGDIAVPEKGCVISFGKNFPSAQIPKVGDTLVLRYSTDKYSDIPFTNAVSGTPRLVRNGIADPENSEEGSNGKRFVYWQLPRTAVGTNIDRTKLYLVAVEPSNGKDRFGANLQDLSNIMKIIGCSDAMNLDGGGSTAMVVHQKNVVNRANPEAGRRISVGIGISTKKNVTSQK